jgi:hypothetical protein
MRLFKRPEKKRRYGAYDATTRSLLWYRPPTGTVTAEPHRVRYSFDMATCPCGWYVTGDDQRLAVWGRAHEEARRGQLLELEEIHCGGDA